MAASDIPQAEKFAKAAREHGTDQDEDAFKGVMRKLGKPTGARVTSAFADLLQIEK